MRSSVPHSGIRVLPPKSSRGTNKSRTTADENGAFELIPVVFCCVLQITAVGIFPCHDNCVPALVVQFELVAFGKVKPVAANLVLVLHTAFVGLPTGMDPQHLPRSKSLVVGGRACKVCFCPSCQLTIVVEKSMRQRHCTERNCFCSPVLNIYPFAQKLFRLRVTASLVLFQPDSAWP